MVFTMLGDAPDTKYPPVVEDTPAAAHLAWVASPTSVELASLANGNLSISVI
jgi:hypothetical protein